MWIEASADGERKAYQLLEQGQELRVEGQKEVRLLVGDAAAVSYTINNRPGRPLGGAGVVRASSLCLPTRSSVAERTDSHQSPVQTDTLSRRYRLHSSVAVAGTARHPSDRPLTASGRATDAAAGANAAEKLPARRTESDARASGVDAPARAPSERAGTVTQAPSPAEDGRRESP